MLSSWSGNNSIVVTTAKAPSSVLASSLEPSLPTIAKQDYGYDNPCVRKLLNESHDIFVRFVDSTKTNSEKNLISSKQLQETSIEFRVCIRACCLGLERELAAFSETNGERDEEYTKLEAVVRFYRDVEVIWNLCDVLFFRPQGSFLLGDLLEWSRWDFTEPDDAVKEMLSWQRSADATGGVHLENHEKYWKTVHAFLLTGRLDAAQKLLNAHSARNTNVAFKCMDALLGSFPLAELPTINGRMAFSAWQEEVKRQLQDGRFITVSELELIAKILLGDENAFYSLGPVCSAWYQPIVGLVLFTQPFAKIFDLRHLIEECFDSRLNSNSPTTSIDRAIIALFELDILAAVKELWHNIDLREYLVFEYGESLMSSGGTLWQIGSDYLAACPTYGLNALRLWLERIPVDPYDFHKTFKLVDIYRKYNLHEAASSVCKENAIRLLKEKDLSGVLTWCIQANDSQFATYIADQILRLHRHSDCLSDLEILSNMDEKANLLSPLLAFLCKYRQAHELRLNGHYKQSACVLSELIASQIGPRELWITLFRDAMELLNVADKEIVFNADQTYKILDALQLMALEIENVKNMNYFVDDQELITFKQDLKMLRMAFVKNLSSALLRTPANA